MLSAVIPTEHKGHATATGVTTDATCVPAGRRVLARLSLRQTRILAPHGSACEWFDQPGPVT
ncbi:hypothetical protein [Leptospira meyeri]|uniref:hypothetical protein n=1 Tax=Leptospira meyeri TaxID=29508 RepID=UPI00110566C1|nr:hypothetical protein [Leptospira meyeri]TGL13309.1 hypothetical protein EHQ50_09545 [Leptospira meyeri]